MATIGELDREMDSLEEAALRVIGNQGMTAVERRQALDSLLRRYNVLDAYRRALAAYIRRQRWKDGGVAEDPEAVIRDLLTSPEFEILRLVVFAALLAVLYGGGPRAALVPVGLLAAVTMPAPASLL